LSTPPLPLPPLSSSSAPSYVAPLSLHDALPILETTVTSRSLSWRCSLLGLSTSSPFTRPTFSAPTGPFQGMSEMARAAEVPIRRSEEHTSELQSRFDLVCRLLLEKKKGSQAQPA